MTNTAKPKRALTNRAVVLFDADFTGVVVTPTSLKLPQKLSLEDWKEIGARLGRAHTGMQWIIGDWWDYGWHKYGERKQQVEEWGGLSFQTCENYASVARRFKPTRRREVLSFAHHAEAAYFEPDEADELLDWCLKDSANRGIRTTRELREEIQIRKSKAALEAGVRPASSRPKGNAPIVKLTTERTGGGGWALTYTSTPAQQPVEPALALDDSPSLNPVPAELRALTIEPVPPIDRLAIAEAVLNDLSDDEFEAVVERCRAKRAARFYQLPLTSD
jgi:hypothetical protein